MKNKNLFTKQQIDNYRDKELVELYYSLKKKGYSKLAMGYDELNDNDVSIFMNDKLHKDNTYTTIYRSVYDRKINIVNEYGDYYDINNKEEFYKMLNEDYYNENPNDQFIKNIMLNKKRNHIAEIFKDEADYEQFVIVECSELGDQWECDADRQLRFIGNAIECMEYLESVSYPYEVYGRPIGTNSLEKLNDYNEED